MRLLLVEDEPKLNEALSYILKKEGYVVDAAVDGQKGLEMAFLAIYDVMIIDWLLPQVDGITIITELRSQGNNVPILLLTAKDRTIDRVQGLDSGADDYLVKPFSTDELLARLRALVRRKGKEIVDHIIRIGNFTFDALKGVLLTEKGEISLTVKEASLLELLADNRGKVITKERIYEKVWGYNSQSDFANVDLYIYYLRKKLGSVYIKTVRGVGYYLEDKGECFIS